MNRKSKSVERSFAAALEHFQAQRFAEAEAACATVLKENKNHADALHLMDVLNSKAGKPEEAVTYLQRAVALNPDRTEVQFNLAKGLRDLNRHEEAFETFQKVKNVWRDRADVWSELGISLSYLGQDKEAVSTLEKAMRIGSESPELLTLLAQMHARNNDFDLAESVLTKTREKFTSYLPAQINFAPLRESQGRINDALTVYESILAKNPEEPEALKRYALALLSNGQLKEGWSLYTKRALWLSGLTSHGALSLPYWSGEDLSDKSLLVWTEQGPGDEILMCSMLSDIESTTDRLVLACSPRMAPLFARSFQWCDVVERDVTNLPVEMIGEVDFQASLTELGAVLRPGLDHLPKQDAYLFNDKSMTEQLRAKYADNDDNVPLVGISWQSANVEAGREKSSKLEAWKEILAVPGCRFVSLQYGSCASEIEDMEQRYGISIVRDKTVDPLVNMDAFAAQVTAMDLVISTTNTTVHVAGSLGVPVWTLLKAQSGNSEDGIALITRATEVRANFSEAYFNLGHIYQSQHAFQQAIHAYTHAAHSRSEYARAWVGLGTVYSDLGFFQKRKQLSKTD